MLKLDKKTNLLRSLILLTILFIATQILFAWINFLTSQMLDSFISLSMTSEVLRLKIFIVGSLKFIFSQIVIYAALVFVIWYMAMSLGEFIKLTRNKTYLVGIFLWFNSVIYILAANTYFVPNSFFAKLIRNSLFQHSLSSTALQYILGITTGILLTAIIFALLNLVTSFYQKRNILRHTNALLFAIVILSLLSFDKLAAKSLPLSIATETQPNIIIIGLDAMRLDCIGENNKQNVYTPHIDSFLNSSIQFSNSYTTLARTFPSWTSILTGSYPLHNLARGNNTDLDFIRLTETLPKQLKLAGYETIYGTDDTRFNNTNESFGFDHIISPPMGVNDFLLGTINDFPLSNLLIPTPIGKLLFPYNYANHGTALTYTPDNFLQLIRNRLHQRDPKPLFMAVHFTLTHWPFYWFNDKQALNINTMERYRLSLQAADNQFNQFLTVLSENKLLDHSIVILLSDHGIAMGLPGDRLVTPAKYQGDAENIKKITNSTYSTNHNFGIDTSYGYGGDLLSLEAYHILLAFKGYGVNLGHAETVTDRVSAMDIAPTLLALLHLPAMKLSDGISLLPYFSNPHLTQNTNRPFFIETTFSPEEIQKENISVGDVLQKTLQFYRVVPETGLVFIKNNAETAMNKDKQFGILQGDWLLVRYPKSTRTRLISNNSHPEGLTFEDYQVPAYLVLVNLKSGQWTTELNTSFALVSPAKTLLEQLSAFYGNELGEVS